MKKSFKFFTVLVITIIIGSIAVYNLQHYRLGLALRDSSQLALPTRNIQLESSDSETTLRLLTYNTWALPVPIPGMNLVRRLPEIPAALLAFDADIIAMQEAFDPRARRYFADKMAAYNLGSDPGCVRELLPFGKSDCDGGLMVHTRLPLYNYQFFPHSLPDSAKFDERNGEKGLSLSQVETSIGPVTVVNIHLYAGREEADESIRMLQLRKLATLLDDPEHVDRPVVLMGDLNVIHPRLVDMGIASEASRAYAFLIGEMGFTDINPQPDPDHITYDITTNAYANLWFNRFENRQIFDYIMVRLPADYSLTVLSLQRILDGQSLLSDHFGLSRRYG